MPTSQNTRKTSYLLNENNIYISAGFLLLIIGFVFWLSKVHSTTMQNEKELSSIRQSIKEIDTKTSDKLNQVNLNMTLIQRSLGSIEGKLEIIVDRKNKK